MSSTVCYLDASGCHMTGEPRDGARLVAVVDMADETQVLTSLPLLRGSGDARRLYQRRLEREFPGVTLRTVLPLRRRAAEGLADVVMIATDSTGALAGELQRLSARWAVRGVYTPSMLAAQWLRLARLGSRQVLIIVPTPAGLRMMFIDQCRPLLSRLMPRLSADKVAVEIGRTIQYLHNTQRVQRDSPLELWFWGMSDAEVAACLPAGDSFRVGAAPQVKGLPDPERNGFDALLQLAGRRPPRAQLAPAALRAGWHAQQLARWGAGLAAGLLVAAGAGAAMISTQVAQMRSQTQAARTANSLYDTGQGQIQSAAADRGLTADQVLLYPEAAAAVRAGDLPIAEAMTVAGHLFAERQSLQLLGLEFGSGGFGTAAQGGCAAEAVGAEASLQAAFRVSLRSGVRANGADLLAVRTIATALPAWRPGVDAAGLGVAQTIAVQGGASGSTGEQDLSLCLLRGEAS